MYRLFISVNLSASLLETLRATQNDLKRKLAAYPLRWTRPEGIHLTLKFLGDADPARVKDIETALRRTLGPHRRFEISMGGLGCFPNPNKTGVLWIGVQDPDKRLQKLAASVDEAIVGLGWKSERRPFTGHLTLARVQRHATNSERRALGQQLPALKVPERLGVIPVSSVHIMRSQLKPQGAIYTSLAEILLND